MSQRAIPYMQIRGGTSKGVYFDARDFPSNTEQRDKLIIGAIGLGDAQIDGLGGATPLTSKVALVSPSSKNGVDIDYLFCQVVVGLDTVDTTPNCGNILAGVGSFAIESGMVDAHEGETRICVEMLNSSKQCELIICTRGGSVIYDGDVKIAGVSGTAAPVICNYQDIAGSICQSLLPTGKQRDVVQGIEVTCIDNGMPVVVMRAKDMGITGYESPAELNANKVLIDQIQSIRLEAGSRMNLGNVDGAAVPKMCLISEARDGGLVNTRTFIPYKCHEAIGVLGAVSVATACLLPNSVAKEISGESQLPKTKNSSPTMLSIEHPSGEFACAFDANIENGNLNIVSVGLVRTARLISRGEVYIPQYQV